MILFTGNGKISNRFKEYYPAKIISARSLSDRKLSEFIQKANIVIHNSALIDSNNFDKYIESNFLLTRRIVKICEEVNPGIRFINISSMSILSDSDNYLDPDSMTDYAYSKFISENYCLRSKLLNLTSVRFSTIFYSDSERDGISKLIMECVSKKSIKLLNEGADKRDIIPLRIAVDYLYKLSQTKSYQQKTNIVSGKEYSFKDLVKIVMKYVPDLRVSNKKLKVNKVLSKFSLKDVEQLGRLEIDLDVEIGSYIKRINEGTNL